MGFSRQEYWSGLPLPSTHGHYQMVSTKTRLIIFFAGKDGEALYSQQKQDRELTQICGSDHELLITKFSLEFKKVGKTTRLFRYDLNQIPYYYLEETQAGIKITGRNITNLRYADDTTLWRKVKN